MEIKHGNDDIQKETNVANLHNYEKETNLTTICNYEIETVTTTICNYEIETIITTVCAYEIETTTITICKCDHVAENIESTTDSEDDELQRIDNELQKDWDKELKKQDKKKLVYDHRIQQYRGKFSKALFDKYDVPAREKLKEVLQQFICDNPDPYKQDFIINSDSCKYKYLEVQVYSKWINEIYPLNDKPWVYARKSVYSSDTLFITLSKNLKYALIFDADSFKNSKPRRIKKYSREFVYDVPWNRIMKVSIDALDKETIELY